MCNLKAVRVQLFGPKLGQEVSLAPLAERERTKSRLQTAFPTVTVVAEDHVQFALDRAIADYDLARDQFKSVDGKAATIAGLVATGIGALGIFGDTSKIVVFGYWLHVGVACLAISLGFAVLALAPMSVSAPSLSSYLSPDVFMDPDSMARAKLELTSIWVKSSMSFGRSTVVKSRRLRNAAIFLGLGLCCLLVNLLGNLNLTKLSS